MSPQLPNSTSARITLAHLRKLARAGETFAMLTCYDAITAKHLWKAGIRTLLVGDTASQMVLGYPNTLGAKMPFMLEITAAVRRGAPDAFIMADMPIGSYHCGDDLAMANALSFMQDAGADCVKFEMVRSHAPLVRKLSDAGIPVVAHIGSRPQAKLVSGRSRTLYRHSDIQSVVDDAKALAQAGAVMLLLEAVPKEVSQAVVDAMTTFAEDGHPVLVIGCGAGPACHGHVVVLHDILGLTDWHAPFAPVMGQIGEAIQQAAGKYKAHVESGDYLKNNHPYELEPES
jgi:3-methyl-2-oxobutanoate hydroxymethyltransferase